MLSDLPLHRIILFAVIGFVLTSIITNVRWDNVGALSRQIASSPEVRLSAAAKRSAAAETVRDESKEARRERLKDDALRLGRAALNQRCDPSAREAYRIALVSLAQQRQSDMGCRIALFCDIEKGFKEVSYKYYATEKDRTISSQFHAALRADVIALGELGSFQYYVGHPDELALLSEVGARFTSPTACSNGRR